jgi:pre-mRNA-processing factor 19
LLAAGGTDSQIKIFDVKSGSEAAVFDLGAPVRSLLFSENGIWLAALAEGSSSVSVWDLRKSNVIKSLEMGGKVDTISWDYTGQFLAGGGPGGITVQQYSKAEKEWSIPFQAAVPATAIAWGTDARSLLAVDKEGVLTVLGSEP